MIENGFPFTVCQCREILAGLEIADNEGMGDPKMTLSVLLIMLRTYPELDIDGEWVERLKGYILYRFKVWKADLFHERRIVWLNGGLAGRMKEKGIDWNGYILKEFDK